MVSPTTATRAIARLRTILPNIALLHGLALVRWIGLSAAGLRKIGRAPSPSSTVCHV